MQVNRFPPSVAAFLAAGGGEDLLKDETHPDLAGLVRFFRGAEPAPAPDPLSPARLEWAGLLLEAIEAIDQRIYEHYRAMADLFRGAFLLPGRESLLAVPSWAALAARGVRLGLLPADLFGENRPAPHIGGVSPTYFEKRGARP
ncbi:MAG: hypothetical protein IKE24_03760 [Clostridia bacterium]|nr:hypothetical protein [Clostridia bacterium]